MTIEEKFNTVPCDLLINTETSPYVWRFEPDCSRFFLDKKSDIEENDDFFDFVETPYRESDPDLLWQIFWSLLDEDDVKYLKENYKGSYDDHPAFAEFLDQNKLGSKLYWAKKKYPMYLLDSWERKHELYIDWDCVSYN